MVVAIGIDFGRLGLNEGNRGSRLMKDPAHIRAQLHHANAADGGGAVNNVDRLGSAARALSYETTILPRARNVAQLAELAYSKGAMSLTELIDARRTLRTILIEALIARTDHAKASQAWMIRQL